MFRRRQTYGLRFDRPARYIVRHARLALYWRDPYGVRARAGDPRSDWDRDMARAYRFPTEAAATGRLLETREHGKIIPIAHP